jgi:pSer/pThr/pTyr-binding forkhead associated (FHA) protein
MIPLDTRRSASATVLNASSPLVVTTLVAITNEAQTALGGKREIRITHFPFKIGRESRVVNAALNTVLRELRLGIAPKTNDLYLFESPHAELMHISREHFAIEYANDQFFVLDRGSACGTIVAGIRVGGDRQGGRAALGHGDEITVGSDGSRYIFRFEIDSGSNRAM